MPTPTKISRRQVLAAAMRLLHEDGLEALSMREMARRLDVKAPSLYRYYPDKISIERDVVDAGNRLLLEALQRAARALGRQEALLAAGRAYRRFARARPHLYSLMMQKRLTFPPVSESGKRLWQFVLGLVGTRADRADPTAAAVAVWSFLHGFVLLEHAGMFGASGPRDGFTVGMQALAKR